MFLFAGAAATTRPPLLPAMPQPAHPDIAAARILALVAWAFRFTMHAVSLTRRYGLNFLLHAEGQLHHAVEGPVGQHPPHEQDGLGPAAGHVPDARSPG